ncbi:MAG TPA: DMT family transporter [Pyrodictium sp.]|nr:DMT family transporter [Pyrodictium sp.]
MPICNAYCLVAGAGLAAHFCLWFESLRYTSVAVSTMIVTTYPLWLGLVDLVVGSVGWIEVVGIVIGLIGLTLFFYPIPASNLYGLLLSLGGSLAITVYFYAGRLARLQGQSAIDYSRATYLTAFLLVLAYLALTKTNPFEVKPSSILPLILLGLGPMAVGHTLINYVLKHMPASKATSIILLEPYIAALLAAITLGEKPKPTILPALIVTGVGTITTSLGHVKHSKGKH